MRDENNTAGILIVEDVTESRKEEKRQLEFAIEKQRVKVITEFIENAKHEFRTPLAIIESSLYLAERAEDPEKRSKSYEKMRRQIHRIARLVDELVTMSRLDSSDLLQREPLNVNYAMRLVAAEAQLRCMEKGIELELLLAENMPSIHGNNSEIVQALHELIDNAINFTPAAGSIKLCTSFDAEHIYFHVSDSGIGIREEAIEHIFERFYRTDRAHTTAGFGLGLSIVRSIINRHHGQIHVESTPDEGTTFRVTLPRDQHFWDHWTI
jgi:signal transduction histidine kinase